MSKGYLIYDEQILVWLGLVLFWIFQALKHAGQRHQQGEGLTRAKCVTVLQNKDHPPLSTCQ
jgi:hypothetical protein